MNASENAFRKILEKYPNLCAGGMAPPESRNQGSFDFTRERAILEEAFLEFSLCCDWLLDCTPLKHVSFVSPVGKDLVPHVETRSGASISRGALIAAVLYLRLPHRWMPDSTDLKIGISLRSPTFKPEGDERGGRKKKAAG